MNQIKKNKFMMESVCGPEIVFSGKTYLHFGTCGYLDLQGHPDAIKAGIEAYQRYGTSAGGLGRAYDTCTDPTLDAEAKAAEFFGTEAAIYFASGYLTGMVGLMGLKERFDTIFIDDTAHYSLEDAATLTGKPVFTFAHCDPDNLLTQIKGHLPPGSRPIILSDGVFPTFGELAPVDEYLKIAERYDGLIFLDEAHSAGVTGPNGRGSFDHFGLISDRIFYGATLSKAFGAHGAVIPCSFDQFDHIRSESNVLKGATSPALPCAAHAAKSLEIVMNSPEIRERLRRNTAFLKDGIRNLGFDMNHTEIPIATFSLGSEKRNARIHEQLLEQGIFAIHSRYVGAGLGGALRFAVIATHTQAQIDHLLSVLKELV